MKFELPVASRQRLDELLEYLGDRADDFKKCFDIESEWCWMYSDLVLRFLVNRKLKYAEGHHIVPYCYYKTAGYTCMRSTNPVSLGNLVKLTWKEHCFAHYLGALCARQQFKNGLCIAFWAFYKKLLSSKHDLPAFDDVLNYINEHGVDDIKSNIESYNRLETEGRTHFCDDPIQARKDVYYKDLDQSRAKGRAVAAKIRHKMHAQGYRKCIDPITKKRIWKKVNTGERCRCDKRPVWCWDKNLTFVCRFECVADAARRFNAAPQNIRKACTGKYKSCANHIFRYEDDLPKAMPTQPVGKQKTTAKQVIQYDMAGNYIATHQSITEAGLACGCSSTCVGSVCNHKQLTCGGFIFRFSNDNSPLDLPGDTYFNPHISKGEVIQYDSDGLHIISRFKSGHAAARSVSRFNSGDAAAKSVNAIAVRIHAAIKKNRLYNGYKWAYADAT